MVVLLIIISLLVFLLTNVLDIGIYSFIFFVILISLDILKNKTLTYIQIWNFAYCYMVCSEMILRSQSLQNSTYGIQAVKFIIISNIIINLGYYLKVQKIRSINTYDGETVLKKFSAKNFLLFYLFISLIFFIAVMPQAILAFKYGRIGSGELNSEFSGTFIYQIIFAIGLILPTFIIYYYRFILNYKYTLPIIFIFLICNIPYFLIGTRFNILFSFIAPVLLLLVNKKLKKIWVFACVVSFLLFNSLISYIRENRESVKFEQLAETQNVFVTIAQKGSDEGIVTGMTQILDYVNKNEYTYGSQSGFIFYFLIPRSIWPDKPTQTSYWLVREYDEVSDSFSAAYGYWGELYMDFGYFSIIIFFIIGMLISTAEGFKNKLFKTGNPKIILFIILYPYLFFSVRSPITSFIILVNILLVYAFFSLINKKLFNVTYRRTLHK